MFKLISSLLVILTISQSVVALLSREDFGEKLLEVASMLHNRCIIKSGVNEVSIEGIAHGNFVDDMKVKKYIACLWVESEAMNEDGSLNMEVIEVLCPPKLKREMEVGLPRCHAETAGIRPLYERTYQLTKCFYERYPDHFFVL
ncbi:general odorant-binding protein 83a [Leptinotarsa decemlineata]|uniref:general odorant-binding protein 83a n=1 Tax=Leptinotarsa decemlineata TaxID=7539 RepID=UPI003D304F0A